MVSEHIGITAGITAGLQPLLRPLVVLLAVYIPAALLCARVFYPEQPGAQLAVLAAMLLQPAAILIDHGHFQYNNISLGLTVRFCCDFKAVSRNDTARLFVVPFQHSSASQH